MVEQFLFIFALQQDCTDGLDHKSLGEVFSNIGSVADAQRDWLKSIPYYERAIQEFRRVNAKRELAGAFNNLEVATEMLTLGNFDRPPTPTVAVQICLRNATGLIQRQGGVLSATLLNSMQSAMNTINPPLTTNWHFR